MATIYLAHKASGYSMDTMWFIHLINFFGSCFNIFFSTIGTTIWGFAAVLVDSVVSIGVSIYRVRKQEDAVRELRKTASITLQTVLYVTLIIYGPIFVWSIGRAVYVDHQYFVEKTKGIPAKDAEIRKLKEKLNETAYRPDRRLSGEQENALYLALRDAVQNTPQKQRVIYLGSIEGDKESERFRDLFLYPLFERAGWTMHWFTRTVRHKDSDLPLPGFSYADVSLTTQGDPSKPQQWTEEWKRWAVLYTALRSMEQSGIHVGQGTLDKHDPLRGKPGVIVWINPKHDGPK